MKTKSFIPVLFLAVGSLLMSCSNNDNSPTTGNTTGDYWPMALNNKWEFASDGVAQSPMKIISTEQINGKTYYKYDNMFGTSTSGSGASSTAWTRKDNGTYYMRAAATLDGGGMEGFTISPIEFVILKDNLNVNGTWSENVTQTVTMPGMPDINTTIVSNGKILEKDVTLNVDGTAYQHVIKVELKQSTMGTVTTNYYWFAKDVGIIQYQNIIPSEDYDKTYTLTNYVLN